MTVVRCPIPGCVARELTTWHLQAHLYEAHDLDPRDVAIACRDSLEEELARLRRNRAPIRSPPVEVGGSAT